MAKNDDREIVLAGTMPALPACGLWEIFEQLVNSPGDIHIGIVFVDAMHVRSETDTGALRPTVRLRQIEIPLDPDDIKTLHQMADRLQSERTGQMRLMEPDPE